MRNLKFLFLLIILWGCSKETLRSDKAISLQEKNNAIEWARQRLDNGEFLNYKWEDISPIILLKGSNRRGWIVPSKISTSEHRNFLVISTPNGEPEGLFVNSISYKLSGSGTVPISLSNKNVLTGNQKDYDILKINAKQDQQGIRNIKRRSTEPFSTLPIVIVVGSRPIPGLNLAPGTYAGLINAALIGLVPHMDPVLDPSTSAEYILPAPTDIGGSIVTVNLDDLEDFYLSEDNELFTPEYFPGKDDGYKWRWWDAKVADEPESNLEPFDPNFEWWDQNGRNANITYPKQPKPNYFDVYNNYPKNDYGYDLEIPEVANRIGGEVKLQYDQGNISNACAIRVSFALNHSGINIPEVTGKTWKGSDGKNYFRMASDLFKFLNDTFDEPNLHKTSAEGGKDGLKFPSLLRGFQNRGIYIMRPKPNGGMQASGHATLWGGADCIGGKNYFGVAQDVYIWILPQ